MKSRKQRSLKEAQQAINDGGTARRRFDRENKDRVVRKVGPDADDADVTRELDREWLRQTTSQ